MYQLLKHPMTGEQDTTVKRLSDGALIPSDPANVDWQEYQKWLAEDPNNQPLSAED